MHIYLAAILTAVAAREPLRMTLLFLNPCHCELLSRTHRLFIKPPSGFSDPESRGACPAGEGKPAVGLGPRKLKKQEIRDSQHAFQKMEVYKNPDRTFGGPGGTKETGDNIKVA
jgi:hypothetical protein